MTQHNENQGRDQFIINQPGTVSIQERERPSRPRNELILLQAVKDEVNGRLDQSLHNAVLINLGKQAQPEQVKRPWDAEIKIGAKSPQPLPAEISILEIFERQEIAGRLLILGDPGSGKTTTMLDLAQAWVHKAEAEITAPIPVLVNLSSWKDPRLELKDWLLEELKSKYGVRKELGTQWLQDKQLLPLLDGLDEVKPEHQESCVRAINQWLQSDFRPMSLLVCSRREEYGSYETRLDLNGAILLQALTEDQIQDYLTSVQTSNLWQVLQQDTALLELLRTPLLLSITVLSYESLSMAQWQQVTSIEKRLELLLDAYVEKMLHREINSRAYGEQTPPIAKQTRHWLVILAQQLEQESQTEFLIEKIQPTWVESHTQKVLYRLVFGLNGAIPTTLSFILIGWLSESSKRFVFGVRLGLLFGIIAAIMYTTDEIRPVEGLNLKPFAIGILISLLLLISIFVLIFLMWAN